MFATFPSQKVHVFEVYTARNDCMIEEQSRDSCNTYIIDLFRKRNKQLAYNGNIDKDVT